MKNDRQHSHTRRHRPLFPVLTLVSGMGSGNPGQIEMVHEPRFTTFSYNVPQTRYGYPGGPWGESRPDQTSGYDYMMQFVPGKKEDSHVAVQRVVLTGWRWHSRNDCGDWPIRVAHSAIEYFRSPANDVQWCFSRPIQNYSGHVEGRYSETRAGIAAYVELAGSPPAIQPGENAEFLDAGYLTSLTPDERAELDPDRLDEASFLRWEHQKQYDGCKPPDGSNHILNHTWWPVVNGKAGTRKWSRYAGSGGQW